MARVRLARKDHGSSAPGPPEPAADDGPRDRVAEEIVADGDGTQITATRTYYDGEPEQGLPLGQVDVRGVVVRTETWLAGDMWAPTLRQCVGARGDPLVAGQVSARLRVDAAEGALLVDAHGNVTQLRDAEGGTLRRRYDDAGLFPVEERFVLGSVGDLVTTATWDARFGQPRSVTAPSGATTRAEYDGLGRPRRLHPRRPRPGRPHDPTIRHPARRRHAVHRARVRRPGPAAARHLPRRYLLLVALGRPPALNRGDLANAPDFAGGELDLDVDHEGFAGGSVRPPPGGLGGGIVAQGGWSSARVFRT